jgi:hypothetical protein
LRIAAQLDERQISETEAQARMMEGIARVQAEEQRRNEDAAVRNAAIRTMNAATTSSYVGMIGTGLDMMRGR